MCSVLRLAYHEELIAVELPDSDRGMGGQKYLKRGGIFLRAKGVKESGKSMWL
ncbi:hypothetical protein GCM10027295_11370 [Pseudaeromonas pectinilytica]